MKRLLDLLLTTDRHQRLRLAQSGLASLLMLGSVMLMHAMALLGLSDSPWLGWWTAVSLVGLLGAFGLIRSGWSQRLRDPSMTMAQMVYAIACAAAGYAIAGRAHSITTLYLTLVLMFGMFGLTRARMLFVGGYALTLLGTVMVTMQRRDPVNYPAALEAVNFGMTAVVITGVIVLSGRLSMMRERLRHQRHELSQAVVRIGELATHDELTGLVNRRRMREWLDEARERSLRSGHRWCVALIDVDHFKLVNDHYGHGVGDQVLQALAQAGLAQVRKLDLLARWGGEEFVLLLQDAGLAVATSAVERWRQAQAERPIATPSAALRVTFSAGVAEHRPGETVEQTLARADEALYAAKAQGRNRVVPAD
jgi:diguanylate cyclase (GGDEF)-like protein